MSDEDRLTIITGGPGAGKTRALVQSYLDLPEAIQRRAAVLTATSEAARELLLWIRGRQPDRPTPRATSFARFPGSILRMLEGFDTPQPLDEIERRLLLSRLIAGLGVEAWASNAEALAEDAAAAIGLCQRYRRGPADLERYAASCASQREDMQRLARLYRAYDDTLVAAGLHDFDSLGRAVLEALSVPAKLKRIQAGHAVLFVDEAQNLDPLQVELLARIAGTDGRIVAAVDPSQRTQAYRGACEDVVAELERALGVKATRTAAEGAGALPGTAVEVLARFRRGPAPDGEVPVASAEEGAVRFVVGRDADDEADRVAGALIRAGGSAAVLVRSTEGARAMRERLADRGIPVAAPETAEACLVRRFLRDALLLLAYEPDRRTGAAAPLKVVERRAEVNAAAVRMLCTANPDITLRSQAVDACAKADKTASCLLDLSEDGLPDVTRWLAEARREVGLLRQLHSLFCNTRPHLQAGACTDGIVNRYGSALKRLERVGTVFAACGETLTADAALGLLDMVLPPAEGSNHASVEVLVPTSAAGRRWQTVVIAGLNDGEYPQWAVPSPFFTAETVAELTNWLTSALPAGARVALGRFERGTAETLAEERRLFHSALARTERDLVLSCRLREGANDLAPSAFLLRCLPDTMLVDPRARSTGWRCVLGGSLPESDSGLASCEGCAVDSCAGRAEAASGSSHRFVERPAREAPAAGPAALAPDRPLSTTDIETYCKCPRGFFLDRVLRVTSIEGDDLIRGNVVHKAFETFHGLDPGDRTPEALRTCVESALREARPDFATPAAYSLQERRILAALGKLLEAPPDWSYEVLGAERWVDFSLTDSEGQAHAFAGRVDLVRRTEAGVEVVDLKASNGYGVDAWRNRVPCADADGPLPNGKEISVQMPLYAIALARQDEPVVADAIVLEFVHHKGCQTIRLPIGDGAHLSPDALAILERHVANLAQVIKSGSFLDAPRDGSCGGWDRPCACEAICD